MNLAWTATGDGALRALAGKPHLHTFRSGNGVTDAGIALLHELPVFKTWQGGPEHMALLTRRRRRTYSGCADRSPIAASSICAASTACSR